METDEQVIDIQKKNFTAYRKLHGVHGMTGLTAANERIRARGSNPSPYELKTKFTKANVYTSSHPLQVWRGVGLDMAIQKLRRVDTLKARTSPTSRRGWVFASNVNMNMSWTFSSMQCHSTGKSSPGDVIPIRRR